MTHEMDASLRDAVRRADDEEACVVICSTGAGKGFAQSPTSGVHPDPNVVLRYGATPDTSECFQFGYLRSAPKPVAAETNGAAIDVVLCRFPNMVSIRGRPPKMKTGSCLGAGKAISSKVLTTSPPSAFWSNGPAARCCLRGWKTR